MVASKIREIISVSRRTARGLKQTIEDIAEQLIANHRESHVQPALQPIPVRAPPARHPLLDGLRNSNARAAHSRNYSTLVSKRSFSTSKTTNFNILFGKKSYIPNYNYTKRINASSMARNVVYQAQPFRTSGRVGTQFANNMSHGGVPSNLYRHFTQHNARMFSTYGANVASQAVHNLTQGLRAGFIKGGGLAQQLSKGYVGSMNANPAYVDKDIKLARTDSEASELYSEGCFVEFTIPTSAYVPSVVSTVTEQEEESHKNIKQDGKTHRKKEKFLLDDEIFDDFKKREMQEIKALLDQVIFRETVWKEIESLRDGIGTAITERLSRKSNVIYRFYYPDCERSKMERHLNDLNIVHGTVVSWSESSLASSSGPPSIMSTPGSSGFTPIEMSRWSTLNSEGGSSCILSPTASESSASDNDGNSSSEEDLDDFSFYYADEQVLSDVTPDIEHVESVSSIANSVVIASQYTFAGSY